jgi:hypothetical protein
MIDAEKDSRAEYARERRRNMGLRNTMVSGEGSLLDKMRDHAIELHSWKSSSGDGTRGILEPYRGIVSFVRDQKGYCPLCLELIKKWES